MNATMDMIYVLPEIIEPEGDPYTVEFTAPVGIDFIEYDKGTNEIKVKAGTTENKNVGTWVCTFKIIDE